MGPEQEGAIPGEGRGTEAGQQMFSAGQGGGKARRWSCRREVALEENDSPATKSEVRRCREKQARRDQDICGAARTSRAMSTIRSA